MTQTFVVADPRTFEGDPYEVADRAFQQATAVATVLIQTLADARVMARNAEMSRQIERDGDADAPGFEDTALAKQIDKNRETLEAVARSLAILRRAAAYNPKAVVGRD